MVSVSIKLLKVSICDENKEPKSKKRNKRVGKSEERTARKGEMSKRWGEIGSIKTE